MDNLQSELTELDAILNQLETDFDLKTNTDTASVLEVKDEIKEDYVG